jgi:hypothetical protein
MTEQSFEATYSQMSDGELARVLRDKRDLVPEARTALDIEIQKRQLDPEQLRKLRPHSIDKPRHRTLAEERLAGKKIRGVWLIAGILLSLLLAAVLGHFGKLQLFWPVSITILVPVFTLWGHSELIRRPWFWMTIVVVTAAHAIFFYFAGWPWGTKWIPAKAIEGFVTLDLIAIFALISVIEKFLHEDQSEPSAGA